MPDHRIEVPQSVQAIPSLGAILLFITEKDVNWWAALVGLVFILVQLLYVLWKWRRDIRRERAREAVRAEFEVTE